jgi:hypothetical protein
VVPAQSVQKLNLPFHRLGLPGSKNTLVNCARQRRQTTNRAKQVEQTRPAVRRAASAAAEGGCLDYYYYMISGMGTLLQA